MSKIAQATELNEINFPVFYVEGTRNGRMYKWYTSITHYHFVAIPIEGMPTIGQIDDDGSDLRITFVIGTNISAEVYMNAIAKAAATKIQRVRLAAQAIDPTYEDYHDTEAPDPVDVHPGYLPNPAKLAMYAKEGDMLVSVHQQMHIV